MSPDEQLPTDLGADDEPTQDTDRPVIIRSCDILKGSREVWIEHGNDMYRLRVTSLGKLYLTK